MVVKSPFHSLSESELRDVCKSTLEALEHWLRRLIHEQFQGQYGTDYIHAKNSKGDFLIKGEIRKYIDNRCAAEPRRYARPIDAALLAHAIAIICKRENEALFRPALRFAFPSGMETARIFLGRLIEPRNLLSHANSISVRQAEQVICYSHDVIESLKQYYVEAGNYMEYNVPFILKFSDSFGNTCFVNQLPHHPANGNVYVNLTRNTNSLLHPGETLSIEIEMDPTFPRDEYELIWGVHTGHRDLLQNDTRLTLQIEESDICVEFQITCMVRSNKSWHKYLSGADEILVLSYKVIPR